MTDQPPDDPLETDEASWLRFQAAVDANDEAAARVIAARRQRRGWPPRDALDALLRPPAEYDPDSPPPLPPGVRIAAPSDTPYAFPSAPSVVRREVPTYDESQSREWNAERFRESMQLQDEIDALTSDLPDNPDGPPAR